MMFTPDKQPDYLPKSMIEMVQHIGLKATLTLVELRGGVFVFVPNKASSDHWLVEHIGLDALEKLVCEYQGLKIEIPRCHAALRAMKEQAIMAESQSGVSNTELARKYGYTDRGIRMLRRRVEQRMGIEPPQQDLF